MVQRGIKNNDCGKLRRGKQKKKERKTVQGVKGGTKKGEKERW